MRFAVIRDPSFTHTHCLYPRGFNMPPAKHKPSEIAAEAKKSWIPYLRDPQNNSEWSLSSFLCYSDYIPPRSLGESERKNIRFAFYDRDPIDVALDWAVSETYKIPVIMPANDKRPGGDWEAGEFPCEVSITGLTSCRCDVT